MISVDNVSHSYGKRKIIDGLNLSVERGECAVFAGSNGSGKTTAVSIIAGIIKPSSGAVSVGGRIGYVPQGTALIEDATVGENLRFFADLSSERVPSKLPFDVGKWLGRRVSRLSGGMKKQVSIACAMIGDPEVILLDEPCASLDISFRDELTDMILGWKAEGRAIVCVAHDPAEIWPIFDKLVIFDGTPGTYVRGELPEDEKSFENFLKNMPGHIRQKVRRERWIR